MMLVLALVGFYATGMLIAGLALVTAVRWFPHPAARFMFDYYSEKDWTVKECRNEVMDWFWIVVVAWWLSVFIIMFIIVKAIVIRIFKIVGHALVWAFGPSVRIMENTARTLSGADKE